MENKTEKTWWLILNKALDKTKRITGIEKLDNNKILIDADDKLPDDITLKIVAILMTCVIKDDGKYYQQIFLEEALFLK